MTEVMTPVPQPRARGAADARRGRRGGMRARERSLWHYLGVAISAALLVLVAAIGVAVIVVPAVTHSVPLTVLTSSMEPTLPPGTLVVDRTADPAEIRIGDVVTYQPQSGNPMVITHRVIAITHSAGGELSFTVQGDNNSAPDAAPVRPVQIQGRVWYSVPWIGWVNQAVAGGARAWIAPVLAGGLFLYAGWMIIASIRGRRTRTASAAGRMRGRHLLGAAVPGVPQAGVGTTPDPVRMPGEARPS